MPSNHDASRIVDINGIAPTVKENHGTVTAVLVDDTYKNRELRLYDKYSPEGICPTLNGIGQGGNTEPKIIVVGRLDIKGKDQIRRVYDPDGLAPTLSTMQGGQQQPKVIIYD